MRIPICWLLGLPLTIATLWMPAPAQPQAVLKLRGAAAEVLVAKALRADVSIDRQFATSTLLLTYQNRSDQRIEAEFHYAAPAGSVVTGFAYWYGNEKVTARVVEKRRAAAIYKTITSRQRDPALVELVGGNVLHARIFPVMPNADLKVEIRYVQVLPSSPQGTVYTLPLRGFRSNPLDQMALRVRVRRDVSLADVLCNLGLAPRHTSDGYEIALGAANYRVPDDLRVRLNRRFAPLRAELYAAPSGGADGFFALVLTPSRAVRRPSVAIRGIRVYDLTPSRLPDAAPNHATALFGRYRGSGRATVEIAGRDAAGPVRLSAPVTFGTERVPQNLAAKLWAAERIRQLGPSGRRRSEVIALSMAHTIPSRYTSWLAIPTAERRRFQQEITRADAQRVAGQLARLIEAHRSDSPTGLRLRNQLAALARAVGSEPGAFLDEELFDQIRQLAERYVRERHSRQPDAARLALQRKRLGYLCRFTRESTREIVANAERSWSEDETLRLRNGVAKELAQLVKAHRADTPAAAKLRSRLVTLCRPFKGNADVWLSEALMDYSYQLGEQIVAEEHRPAPDPSRLAHLRDELEYVCRNAPRYKPDTFTYCARQKWNHAEEQRTRARLIAELNRDVRDEARIAQLKNRWVSIWPTGEWPYEIMERRFELLRARADVARLQRAIIASPPDRVDPLCDDLHQAKARETELRARMGDPLIQVDAPADARSVVALMPDGTVKPLEYDAARSRWQARFDIPTYAHEGAYVITVIVVLRDGTRRVIQVTYHVDLTAPRGSASASLAADPSPTLRLEVHADADTARVEAVLPWGEIVRMRAAGADGHFFALAPVPASQRRTAIAVTYVLTDRAHNRATITVDAAP